MSKLRPIHLAVFAAFLAGVLVAVGITSALGGDDEEAPSLAGPSSLATPAASAIALPTTPPAATQPPAAAQAAADPTRPALTSPAPLLATPTALQRPGICNPAAEPTYIARAQPVLQQLGNSYQGWRTSIIATSSEEMKSLRQILATFTGAFEAITPLPEGCNFIHSGLIQAAKDLGDTAGHVDSSTTPALRAGWDTEYNGRIGNMKAAMDIYLTVTSLSLNPRPFP